MNKDNLLKLATYLLSGSLKARFSMEAYADIHHRCTKASKCGTIGCAAGHGPYAGVPKTVDESWTDYVERVFGLEMHSEEWIWCFWPDWLYIDNSPKGAGKRILYLLRKGLPENWSEQKNGLVSLCYLNETL